MYTNLASTYAQQVTTKTFAVKNWSNSCIATRVLDSYLMHYYNNRNLNGLLALY
jgi:hypothetical protein